MSRKKNTGPCTHCTEPSKVRGMCGLHYDRFRRGTDMTAPKPVRGGRLPKAVVGYRAAHNRIDVQRGKARTYFCVDCDTQASDWSLKAGTEGVLASTEAGSYGYTYSLDPLDYEPRCRKCHLAYDGVNPS